MSSTRRVPQGQRRLSRAARTGHRLTREDGEAGLVTRVAEGDADALFQAERINVLLGDVEGDGHGEEEARLEAESVPDTERGSRVSSKN